MTPLITGRSPVVGVLPLRVLCVDDNRDVADSSVDFLSVSGTDARACYSGAAALAEIVTFRPDVCLIDLNMPGMDGDALAVHIRERCDPCPTLIAMTAMCDDKSRERIVAAGFDMHLVKPVDPYHLLSLIAGVET
jgi:two-component system OmpR family response regulator